MDPLRALLEGIVDYAGLFPPASAPMAEAVAEYSRQRSSREDWMLSAFVVPAARLKEFSAAAGPALASASSPWPLSVLLGADPLADLEVLGAWIRSVPAGQVGVAALEMRPARPEAIGEIVEQAAGVEVFCELPWDAELAPWVSAVAMAGARAKIRCGGVTADLIPPVDRVAAFLVACHGAGIGLKFTAGLHHPVRGIHPLTYEPDAPQAMMHGFLNVFVAAALLAAGRCDDLTLLAVLEETDPTAFAVRGDTVAWRDHAVAAASLAGARSGFSRSFGSCSFREPVEELQQLGLL